MNYWQHRISHNWDVAKQLFDSGYLTIGWQGLSHTEILNEAKKYGEEAGTKLLGPMILLLVIVMMMIMIPAFMSF